MDMQVRGMKAAFLTSFAILLGFGISAIVQTFAWEQSTSAVAQSWQTISALDALLIKTYAVEESSRQLAVSFDPGLAAKLRADLAQVRILERQGRGTPPREREMSPDWQDLNRLLDRQAYLMNAALSAGSGEAMQFARQTWENANGSNRIPSVVDGLRERQNSLIQQSTRRQTAMLER